MLFAWRRAAKTATAGPDTGAPTSAATTASAPRSPSGVLIRLGLASALTTLMFAAAGCDNACESLSDRICGCAPNQAEEAACIQEVNAYSGPPPTAAELAVCEIKLDTCTCEALEDNDLVACGLAKDP